jgi:diguanylate cyclase (GGDEF)-like protein
MPEIGLFAVSTLDLQPVFTWRLFEPFLVLSVSALILIGVAIYWTIGRLVVSRLSELALTTRSLDQALRDQALRDSLTGLFNRRYFDLAIRREIAASDRSGRPFSVALIDFDHFKDVNDTHGHQAGDAALRRLADMLRSMVRSADSVCRWGGDEFAVLMPDTALEAAVSCAERWRQALEQVEMHTGAHRWHFTVSSGLAAYPDSAASPEELMRQMDLALYSAKSTGRNRIGQAAFSPADPA